MAGAPRLWAHSGQCQPCSHTFQPVSQSKISCNRIWSSARVHPSSTHSEPTQNRSARLSQTRACKPSLCGCFASRTRSSTVRRAFPTTRRVFASWGQEIEWSNVKVSSNEAAAQDLKKLVIDLGSLAEGYKTAGQFVQIKVGDSKAGFFAIASPPDSNNQGLVEVLIKDGPPDSTANLLCNISAGAEVSVSPVMGKGFRMERAPASDHPTCLLFATGSGISPIKALIESEELQAHDRKDVRLYYGTRNTGATAYSDLDDTWKAAGVDIVHVYSDDNKGYVQDVFTKGGTDFDASKACAVMVGHKEMCEAVTKVLESKGVAKERILLNF